MDKSLSASKNVMKNYLSELMTDESPVQKSTETITTVVENKHLKDLLSNVNANLDVEEVDFTTSKSAENLSDKTDIAEVDIIENTAETSVDVQESEDGFCVEPKKSYREGDFQALYFDVGGLTLAVPLIELGGIHKVNKTTSLMGKPNWFKGIMLYRDEKINVVDTALWVMPEKYDEKLENSLNYQYIIMLNNSGWGLSAESLVDTVTLNQEEVKWADSPSKRPWLAGLVKNKMCALLDVNSLIQLLNDGSGIKNVDS